MEISRGPAEKAGPISRAERASRPGNGPPKGKGPTSVGPARTDTARRSGACRVVALVLCLALFVQAQDFEQQVRSWVQARDFASLGQGVFYEQEKTRELFARLTRPEDAFLANALARALLLAGDPGPTEELRRRGTLLVPTTWDDTAFADDPDLLARRAAPTMMAAEDPRQENLACLQLAIRVGDPKAAQRMLQALGPEPYLEVLALESGGQARQALNLGARLQSSLGLELALLSAARQLAEPRLVDEHLGKARELLRGEAVPSFVLESVALERALEKGEPLGFDQFLQRHQKAWRHLEGLPVRQLATGEGRWLCLAAQIWVVEALRRQAAEADEFPVRAQLDYLVRRDLQQLQRLNRQAFEESFRLQPAQPHQYLDLWNPELALGLFRLELDTIRRLQSLGQPALARERLDMLLTPRVELEKRFDEATLAFQLAQYAMSPEVTPFSLVWNEGALARLLGVYHLERARAGLDYEADLGRARRYLGRTEGFLGLDDPRWVELERSHDHRLALELKAACRDFRPGLILALLELGEYPEAIELIERHVAESGGGPEAMQAVRMRYRAAYDRYSEQLLAQGRVQEALEVQGRLAQVEARAGLELRELSRGLPELAPAVEELRSLQSAGAQESDRTRFYLRLQEIRSHHPDYERLLAVRPVNFSKIQPYLPPDTTVVQYFPAETTLYCFVLTRESLEVRQSPVGRAQLEERIKAMRNACLRQDDVSGPAGELYQILIAPLDLGERPVLAVIPTGLLHYLPFGALKSPDGKFLIEQRALVSLTKSSDLEQLGRPVDERHRKLLAVGNPDGTLPGAAQEAEALSRKHPDSRLLLGPEATQARFLESARGMGYLHLATHGVLNANNPSSSYLVLAESGRLGVGDIAGLNLDGVRMVTLSACQTALAERAPGSELTTLADAFSFAGSPTLVASLWKVDDVATRELMLALYDGLGEGVSLARSMQRAELALLRNPATSHPFYWAPFVLIGDWR